MKKVNYLVSHPIQYQIGMIKAVNKYCDLQVFYIDDYSFSEHNDNSFGGNLSINWGVDLKSGYKYKVLKKIYKFKSNNVSPRPTLFNPITLINKKLLFGECDAYWIHGYSHYSQILIAVWAKIRFKKLFFRAESNLVFTKCGPIKNVLVKILLAMADKLLYVSSLNKEYYIHYGASSGKLVFMPYAVNNRMYECEIKEANSNDKNLRLVFVGKLIPRKNVKVIIRALSLIDTKNISLVIVGSGSEEQEVANMITEFNLKHCVNMVGFKQPYEVAKILGESDLILVPSFEEAFGLVVNEGMAAGCAVISSNLVGSTIDLVKHNENGFVFNPDDHTTLSKYISKIDQDRVMLKKFKQKSHSIIQEWSYETDALAIKDIL